MDTHEPLDATSASSPPSVRCRICGQPLLGAPVRCPACDTPHHQDCWAYAGGCSVFGCVMAPAAPGPLSLEAPKPRAGGWRLPPRWVAASCAALSLAIMADRGVQSVARHHETSPPQVQPASWTAGAVRTPVKVHFVSVVAQVHNPGDVSPCGALAIEIPASEIPRIASAQRSELWLKIGAHFWCGCKGVFAQGYSLQTPWTLPSVNYPDAPELTGRPLVPAVYGPETGPGGPKGTLVIDTSKLARPRPTGVVQPISLLVMCTTNDSQRADVAGVLRAMTEADLWTTPAKPVVGCRTFPTKR